MNAAPSSSHPPPPLPAAAPAAAAAPPALAAAPEASSLLAPGFRFHPTDEELVSYYLKRKVFGRPLRVDAIAEVELYKAEPWDLPALSRLRSRDMEWYFFSPLDRKYANRSRTNRATSAGYWKTTGKDRPIRRGPRTVGMKKTLVFHVGRAPRGERTNWVMHEYRLEDDELTHAGIPQDSYVVCRIFQKSGTGPQNGAQYGAPFNEEEWEEEASGMPLAIVDNSGDGDGDNQGMAAGGNESAVVGNEGYFQLSDFAENQDQSNQFDTGGVVMADSVAPNLSSAQEDDPIFLVESIFRDQEYTGLVNVPGPQGHQSFSDGGGRVTGLAVQHPSPRSEYLEMNDIVDTIDSTSEESVDGHLMKLESSVDFENLFHSNEHSEAPYQGDFCLEPKHEHSEAPYQGDFCLEPKHEHSEARETYELPSYESDFCLEPKHLDLLDFDYPSEQTGEDNPLFHDASSDDFQSVMDNYIQMNDLYSPIMGSGGLTAVEDVASYFDSSYNSHYPTLDDSPENTSAGSSTLIEPNFPLEIRRTVATPTQAFEAVGASSVNLPGAGSRSNVIKENVAVVPDSRRVEGCNTTLTKRLVNMLGSISAPPALAAEPTISSKSPGRLYAANSSSSSIHVTAGMIQIRGFEVMGRAEHWSVHRNGDMGFLLSCGVASRKTDDGFDSVPKVRGWSMSVVMRGGFYCFLFSALVLALCCKVGIRICSR